MIQLELFDVCPWCGCTEDELPGIHGLDVDLLPGGRRFVSWTPCCEGLRDAVGWYGWELVFGWPLEAELRALGLEDLRHVDLEDSLCLHTLRVEVLTGGPKGTQDQAFAEITEHHRHHDAPAGWKDGLACYNGPARVGVAVLGRPNSRLLAKAEPRTLEVTRLCTWGDRRLRYNASSKLYGAACQAARRHGADKVITYTLQSEDGASLKAAGFREVAVTKGGSWNRPSRARTDKAPTCRKVRWERTL